MRTITSTYAYYPANSKKDLMVDTDIIAKYEVNPARHPLPIDANLEWDIKQHGIKIPLQIYTNGSVGTLGDGNHRLRIARKLGIKKVPVQFIPDLWAHESHAVTRHIIGGNSMSSVKANRWIKCECSCGARWKEEA